jgi:hypothetical protein
MSRNYEQDSFLSSLKSVYIQIKALNCHLKLTCANVIKLFIIKQVSSFKSSLLLKIDLQNTQTLQLN